MTFRGVPFEYVPYGMVMTPVTVLTIIELDSKYAKTFQDLEPETCKAKGKARFFVKKSALDEAGRQEDLL